MARDGVGNTISAGKIVIRGNAGDVCGYAMRGGKIFIKGNVGYSIRHSHERIQRYFPDNCSRWLCRRFLGEYMAGGIIVVLGINAR